MDSNIQKKKRVSYLIPGHYVVNSDVWVMDETYLNQNIVILLVIGLKTTVILGACVFHNKDKSKTAFLEAHFIKQLYEQIIEGGNNIPKIVHNDQKMEYGKPIILEFFKQHKIKSSIAGKNDNQVVESVNNQIKAIIIDVIFKNYEKDSRFLAFKSSIPASLKKLSLAQKRVSKKFRDVLFHSEFLNNEILISEIVLQAVEIFNSRKSQVSETPYDRKTLNKLNNMIIPSPTLLQGAKGSTIGNAIQVWNDTSYEVAAKQIKAIFEKESNPEIQIQEIQNLVITREQFEPQAQQQMMQALIFIACQNKQQLDILQDQKDKVAQILEENMKLVQKVKILTDEKEKKEFARQKRLNREKREKNTPFSMQLYMELMEFIKGNSMLKARIRCAFTILAVTGIRFAELSSIKVKQIMTLLNSNYCPIDRKKRGPSNLKAFLREEGISIIKQRKRDFELLIRTKYENTENEEQAFEAFLFSTEKNPNKPLSRSYFNDALNKVLNQFSTEKKMDNVYTTHSFRHDFITQLWKDSADIEFVRQFMGHKRIESTVSYIESLQDSEKIVKLFEADQAKKQKLNKKQISN